MKKAGKRQRSDRERLRQHVVRFSPRGSMPSVAASRQAVLASTRRGAEKKFLDIPFTTTVISTTGAFQAVNIIQEGSSFYNRVGRRIHMKSLHLTGTLTSTGQGAGVYEYLRVMVVYDRQPNGAYPAIADLLSDYDNTGAVTSTSYAGVNPNNADRFLVLRDIRVGIPLNTIGAAQDTTPVDNTSGQRVTPLNEFIKLSDLETHYKASSNPAVVGDQASGSLFVFFYGNVAAANAAYQMTWKSRLRFTDL